MSEPRNKRKALGKKMRFEVLKRDGFVCQYCGAHPPGVLLQVDHIVPVAEGGTNDTDNLVTACDGCNSGKGARSLDVVPESLALKAARVAEAEEQLRGYQEIMRAKASRIEDEMWEVAEMLWPGSSQKGASRADLNSIKQFIGKLGVIKVMELADVALSSRARSGYQQWRYFCGCCWKVIREGEQ